jgi:general secretion pathway protein K
MTPAIYARIRPALTVYTNNAAIDPQVAPREALLALFEGDAGKVDAALRQRDAPSADQTEDGPSSRPGLLNPSMPLGGRAFEVKAESQGHPHYTRDAVIELTGDVNRPYLVLFWQ